jgi:hypothetical protein
MSDSFPRVQRVSNNNRAFKIHDPGCDYDMYDVPLRTAMRLAKERGKFRTNIRVSSLIGTASPSADVKLKNLVNTSEKNGNVPLVISEGKSEVNGNVLETIGVGS